MLRCYEAGERKGFGVSPGFSALLKVVSVASMQTLAACSADVEIFRSPGDRTGNTQARVTSNDPGSLVVPVAAAEKVDLNCQPGHYVGDFTGIYNSAAWGNGSLPLSIAATPSLGRPGLEFWLERIARNCRSDEEFCADFTLKGGKIRGNADPFSDGNASDGDNTADPALIAVPFEIDFGGELDCTRGSFRGLLQNGCYDFAGTLYRFEGDAPAYYDPSTSTFTGGGWTVKELAPSGAWLPPDSGIGGMGSWQASLVQDRDAAAADGVGLCDR